MKDFLEALVSTIVFFAIIAGLWYGISALAHWGHEKDCTGHATGKCSWAWCEYYDGSDCAHDFTI